MIREIFLGGISLRTKIFYYSKLTSTSTISSEMKRKNTEVIAKTQMKSMRGIPSGSEQFANLKAMYTFRERYIIDF